MSLLKWLVVVCALGFGYHLWSEHKAAQELAGLEQSSPGEFVPTAMPSDARPGTVLILAPVNCPSVAAKRADALAEKLGGMGIPTMRSNHFSANISNPSEDDKASLKRAAAVLSGDMPAVFVNGMGKANPSVQEVVAIYQRTR